MTRDALIRDLPTISCIKIEGRAAGQAKKGREGANSQTIPLSYVGGRPHRRGKSNCREMDYKKEGLPYKKTLNSVVLPLRGSMKGDEFATQKKESQAGSRKRFN